MHHQMADVEKFDLINPGKKQRKVLMKKILSDDNEANDKEVQGKRKMKTKVKVSILRSIYLHMSSAVNNLKFFYTC